MARRRIECGSAHCRKGPGHRWLDEGTPYARLSTENCGAREGRDLSPEELQAADARHRELIDRMLVRATRPCALSPGRLRAALRDLDAGEENEDLAFVLQEAGIAWHEEGCADEAKTDREVAQSQDDWERERARKMIVDELNRRNERLQ